MRIAEIYCSRQGEGRLTGQESVFLRTSGCNLRCRFCDTPFTSWRPEGHSMTVPQIVNQLVQFTQHYVVITGGEPMLPQQIVELTSQLRTCGFHITIETAGTVFRPVTCDLMSISPKLANSTPSLQVAGRWRAKHEQTRLNIPILQNLIEQYDYQLKFVVQAERDLEEIHRICDALNYVDPQKIMLMPEGVEPAVLESRRPWIQAICHREGFTYCPRQHIYWYANQRGT